MITQDMQGRLRSALPALVPVLLPEQQREPLDAAPVDAQGRPVIGAGERGLGAYLRQHPQGYVQVETPLALSSDSLTGTFWVAVAAVAPTPEQAQALALLARRALAGYPYAPGRYREVTPAQPQELAPGTSAWICRAIYEAKTIDGHAASRS